MKLLQFALIAFFCIGSVYGQSKRFSGRVTNSTGAAIQGVTVKVKGSSHAASTDEKGNYTIDVPEGKTILQFSHVGYTTQEITIGNRQVIDVTLKDTSSDLVDVVVVGYVRQKKAT
jgi:TonB-dependent starch-binding outer membrane protein SusC